MSDVQHIMRDRPDELQVESDHYFTHEYLSAERMVSFRRQTEAILGAAGKTVLEIGPGSGHVTRMLRHHGQEVTTIDIDAALQPDHVLSVTDLDNSIGKFDVVSCCQVLEHLPWADFPDLLLRLASVARRRVVISLPDNSPYLRIAFHSDRYRMLGDGVLSLPQFWNRRKVSCEEHCWEIGVGKATLRDVKKLIRNKIGTKLSARRIFEFPYHHFFIVDMD